MGQVEARSAIKPPTIHSSLRQRTTWPQMSLALRLRNAALEPLPLAEEKEEAPKPGSCFVSGAHISFKQECEARGICVCRSCSEASLFFCELPLACHFRVPGVPSSCSEPFPIYYCCLKILNCFPFLHNLFDRRWLVNPSKSRPMFSCPSSRTKQEPSRSNTKY